MKPVALVLAVVVSVVEAALVERGWRQMRARDWLAAAVMSLVAGALFYVGLQK